MYILSQLQLLPDIRQNIHFFINDRYWPKADIHVFKFLD